MFKNIKVEGYRPVPEDVLREMNRGSWSTGYCGQSPERIKAHMRNQAKFDLVTLRAPKDDPEVGGAYYGIPWPRSEVSRVGKECVSTVRSRWSPVHYKKKQTKQK